MKEIFKPIKGYEGYYEISNMGNVKSLQRVVKRTNGSDMVLVEKVLKANPNNKGYLIINLRKDGQRKSYLIHRLIAEAFIPNPEGYKHINHKDENPLNNSIDNLEWCSHKYNIQYSRGITVYQYTPDGKLVNEWESAATACEVSGFTAPNISNVCKGKGTHHKGFKWSYTLLK